MIRLIDISDYDHPECKSRLYSVIDECSAGFSFTVIADHDPRSALRDYQAEHRLEIIWNYVESGPDRWELNVNIESTRNCVQ